MEWFSSKKCTTNLYVMSVKINEKVKFNFVFYSLDELSLIHIYFDTLISRKNTGSLKWEQMYKMNPNVEENVVPLSVADMEFKNAPEITEGLREYLKSAVLGYTSSYKAFTDSIINWMQRRHNFTIKSESVSYTHLFPEHNEEP